MGSKWFLRWTLLTLRAMNLMLAIPLDSITSGTNLQIINLEIDLEDHNSRGDNRENIATFLNEGINSNDIKSQINIQIVKIEINPIDSERKHDKNHKENAELFRENLENSNNPNTAIDKETVLNFRNNTTEFLRNIVNQNKNIEYKRHNLDGVNENIVPLEETNVGNDKSNNSNYRSHSKSGQRKIIAMKLFRPNGSNFTNAKDNKHGVQDDNGQLVGKSANVISNLIGNYIEKLREIQTPSNTDIETIHPQEQTTDSQGNKHTIYEPLPGQDQIKDMEKHDTVKNREVIPSEETIQRRCYSDDNDKPSAAPDTDGDDEADDVDEDYYNALMNGKKTTKSSTKTSTTPNLTAKPVETKALVF